RQETRRQPPPHGAGAALGAQPADECLGSFINKVKIKYFSHRDHRAHRDRKNSFFCSVPSVYSVAYFLIFYEF
ncbi:MAG: hypothetical protein AAB322_06850, partial [Pseudomonadota bacterium]